MAVLEQVGRNYMVDVVRKWSWVRIRAPSSPECDLTLNLPSELWTLAQEFDSQLLIHFLSVLECLACPIYAYTEFLPVLKGIETISSSFSGGSSSSSSSRSSSSNEILRTQNWWMTESNVPGWTSRNNSESHHSALGKTKTMPCYKSQLKPLSGHCHQPQPCVSRLGCASHYHLFLRELIFHSNHTICTFHWWKISFMFALHRPGKLGSVVLGGSMTGLTRPRLPKRGRMCKSLGGLSRVQGGEP